MMHRFLELLPHLINGSAPHECVFFFWAILALCAYATIITEKRDFNK